MKSLLVIFVSTLIVSSVQGATYIPVPIESQIQRSYGAIEGHFQGSSYKKLPDGSVATVASFYVNKHAGIASTDIKNNFDFKIILPGGKWDDLTYFVSGVPNFKKDEKVVLLVSKGKYGTQLHNLGLGKYRVLENDDEKFLVSDVFPAHPRLGKIKYNAFNQLLSKNFGTKLQQYKKDLYVYRKEFKSKEAITDKKVRRGPASVETKKDDLPFNPFVLVLILAAIGAYGTYLVRNK